MELNQTSDSASQAAATNREISSSDDREKQLDARLDAAMLDAEAADRIRRDDKSPDLVLDRLLGQSDDGFSETDIDAAVDARLDKLLGPAPDAKPSPAEQLKSAKQQIAAYRHFYDCSAEDEDEMLAIFKKETQS